VEGCQRYRNELQSLKARASAEIEQEREFQRELLRGERTAPHTVAMVAASLLINAILYFLEPSGIYMLHWIAASFYLVVIYPFLLLVPSAENGTPARAKGMREEIMEFLDRAWSTGVREHKRALGHIFWNTFFVNSRSLAIGLSVIFVLDVLFAISLGFQRNVLSPFDACWVIYQSIAIIVFYAGIVVLKPYKIDFFHSLRSMNRRIRSAVKKTWQVVIVIAALSALLGTLVITAMLLPGLTLGFVTAPHYLGNESILPIAAIFATQFILLRFLQGIHSRMMLLSWSRRKESILQQLVISPPEIQEADLPSEAYADDYSRRHLNYLAVKTYTRGRHTLFGYLPVFLIVPDLPFLLDRETIEILQDNIGLHSPL